MIISLRWLCDFVDVKDYLQKPESLAELLTRAGLEVENITNRAKDFDSVVIGLILEKEKHPNADKLSSCRVSTGDGVVHQIVCGAQNHKANDCVVVALPGAVLPGNFVIKKSVIRGVESGGMLCSEKELGLAKESQGLLILPETAPIGKSYAEYAGFDDVTFELKVTPNRADCLSHYGLAREVACLLGRPLKSLNPQLKISQLSTRNEMDLEVKNPELCPRYAGRFIGKVQVHASPDWMKKRLQSVGMNSINNIVDVTNYVMMELGQPLHAFDAREIKGKKITVDMAKPQEKFQTLDGSEITLNGDELMIRDQERPVAMAGVVGGKNSGVSDATTDIFLEAAYFVPMTVRKASRAHGIITDSGYRFSRGVDPDNTLRAMDRAVELIQQVAEGVAFAEPYDVYPQPVKKQPVRVAVQTISDRLGYVADGKKFADFMLRLGCVVQQLEAIEGNTQFEILPPTFRFDLEHEMDLVEEYARLNGYEHIPETIPLTDVLPSAHDKNFLWTHRLIQVLRGQSLNQAINFAFTAEKPEKDFLRDFAALRAAGLQVSEKPLRLLNPLSDDLNVMRSTLSFSLFRNLLYNFHQGNEQGGLFEIGKGFSNLAASEFHEELRLAMVKWGQAQGLWQKNNQTPLVFSLKASIESLLSSMNIKSYQWLAPSNELKALPFLHLGQQAILQVEGKKIGFVGTLHPVLADENKIRVPVALAELNLELLLQGQPRLERFESVAKFPSVQRDLALLMNHGLAAGDVMKEIKKLGGALLQSVEVFDLYELEKTAEASGAKQKSVAFRLRFQDKNATLQDEMVNKAMEAVVNGVQQKFSITVR